MDSNPNPKTSEPTQPQIQPPIPGHQPHSADYAPYPTIDPKDVTPPPPTTADTWTSVPVGSDPHREGGPQTQTEPAPTPAPFTAPRSSEVPAAPISGTPATSMPSESNPYVSPAPARGPGSSVKNTVGSVKDVLGKWGKKAAEATKKGQDLAGNMWQHYKPATHF